MHKIPVAGVGGLVFTIGIVVLALLGPSDREMVSCWCRDSGCGVVGILRLFRKLHPQTEVEQVQLNVGRQTGQP
jgi:UDP-N-acetylmuramyl pentapeptide phosphotransferase/UDP-N-acetylglucosamine-1-phosphate transferase